jgi:hypothetical protein
VEHAHPIYRDLSWRGVTLTRPALLLLLVLVTLGGWTLLHRVGPPAAAQSQVPLRPRSATSVLVLNGNGIAGAASDMSTRLLTHGYRSAFATDAQVTTYARSVVLFRPGWEREAERLAKDARIRAVAPLDGPLPAGDSRYSLAAIVGH